MSRNCIVFVTTLTLWSMGKGRGGPAFTSTVAKYIDEGWEVYLVSDEPSNANYPRLDARHNLLLPQNSFCKWRTIPKLGIFFRYLDQWAATRQFLWALENLFPSLPEQRTVIYAYEYNRFFPARRFSTRHHIPLVTRFQGSKLVEVKKHTWLQKFRRFPAYNATAGKADLVIMTDDGTQGDRILKELGNESPCMFVKNGLELLEIDLPKKIASFNRAEFRKAIGIQDQEHMFLTVSRLENWKKVERTIYGFSDYIKLGYSGKLVIVGDGPCKQMLKNLSQELKIEQYVTFVGSVAHNEVYEYMMACDTFVSLYDLSNVGNPLLEAMTLGKCIVTLDVGDTKKLIKNRDNVILMTYDTLGRLGEVFAELVMNRALHEKLGYNAAEYAKEHFWSWKDRMDAEFQQVKALLNR